MNKILIGLPISDLQLLLAVSRRIDELSRVDYLLYPEQLLAVSAQLTSVLKVYEDGLEAYIAARSDPSSSARV